jgi:hypothetical protein
MAGAPQFPGDPGTGGTGAILKLQPRGASPPVSSYVTGNQFLSVTMWNADPGITVTVNALLLLQDGAVSNNTWQFLPTSTRSKNIFAVPLTECFLISLAVLGAASGFHNRTFVSVRLQLGALNASAIEQVLVEGYIGQTKFMSWPPGQHEDAAAGPGAIVSVTGTTPAAGAEISETVPTDAVWRLKTFIFKLTASATVASRVTHFVIDDGVNVLINITAPSGVTASNNATYFVGDDTVAANVSDGFGVVQFPNNIRLMPGWRIRTLTTALQAGDQYTAPQYSVEEYLVQ